MLYYIPAGVTNGFENDETFGMNGFETSKKEFENELAKHGYNEFDIESLGYAEIVERICMANEQL